jgi:hypothetical protein
MKICSQCKKELDDSEFYSKRGKCKKCISENRTKRYLLNKKSEKLAHKTYYKLNKNNILKNNKDWQSNNKDKINKTARKNYNPVKAKSRRIKNKIILRKYKSKWRLNNKAYPRLYVLNRRHDDVNFKIVGNLRHRIKKALNGNCKSDHTLSLLGCSLDFLKQHLQSTAIKNGYYEFDINNYDSKQFHIDHVIPCCAFNLSCSYHQKLCFNWSNLQILSKESNMNKLYTSDILYEKVA